MAGEKIDLDSMFHVAVAVAEMAAPVRIAAGLSDEEDAQRLIALKFNSAIQFCRNCETYYDGIGLSCLRCGFPLWPVGTPPLRYKSR